MPDAAAVHEFGKLPLPVLVILAAIAVVLGGIYIVTKFNDGRRIGAKSEDFEVKLATFDARHMQALSGALERNAEAAEDLTTAMKSLNDAIDEHKVELIRSTAKGV